MPWTTPETFTAGQTLTAASMNLINGNISALRLLNVIAANGSAVTSSGGTPQTYMSATITPSLTTSRILILSSATINPQTGSANRFGKSELKRGSTIIDMKRVGLSTTTNIVHVVSHVFLDSPNTTSAVTYNFDVNRDSASTTDVAIEATGDNLPRVVLVEITA